MALGQRVDDLVDADVAQYIHRNKLYKDEITEEKTLRPSELRDHMVAALEDMKGQKFCQWMYPSLRL